LRQVSEPSWRSIIL